MRNHPNNSPVQENFLKTLSTSLHQMAQPLSIIQASLELALLRETTSGEPFREVAECVLEQLGRAVETLRFTSQLSRFQQPASDVTSVLLSEVLQNVIEDLSHTLSTAQIKVALDHSGREREIQFSPVRLRQLFFYILQAVQHLSQPGDIVHIDLQTHAGNIKLRIFQTPDRAAHPTPNASDESFATRALALAEAIVTSTGAEFQVINSPLLIIADFPVRRQSKQPAVDKNSFEGTTPAQFAAGPH
jgi:signal transduction histidine kinase